MQRIAVIDFNSFFASVEQQLNPALRGQPVGVIPVRAETTCCIAASREAKHFGIKTGTPVWQARRLCPGIHFVEAQHERYVRVHQQAVALIDRHWPIRQVLSIDEVSCELSKRRFPPHTLAHAVTRLKRILRDELGECLTVSVGIASNVLLAKLASDMHKPDGCVVLAPNDVPTKFLHLPIGAISGIGRNMQVRLNALGIVDMAGLYTAPRALLRQAWGGVAGEAMHDRLHGADLPAAPAETRSLGHSHVLPPAMRNPQDALAVLDRLTQKAAMRLRKQMFYASAMSIHAWGAGARHRAGPALRADAQFAQTQDTATLLRWMGLLWQRGPMHMTHPQHVGLVLHGLVDARHHQPDLFGQPTPMSPSGGAAADGSPLSRALDTINRKHGKNVIYFGGAHTALEHAPMRIAFNRIPDLETEA